MSRLEEREHLKELLLTVSGFDDGLALTLGGITGSLYSRLEELERVIEQDSRQAIIESLYADNQVYKRALEMIIRMAEDCTKEEYTQLVYEMESAARQALEADKP